MNESALLSLMPEQHTRRSPFLVSFVVQALAVVLLMEMGLIHPKELIPAVKFDTAIRLVATPPQRPAPPPPRRLLTVAEATVTPQTVAPRLLPPPRVAAPKMVARAQPPQIDLPPAPAPSVPRPQPVKVQVVRTGIFNSTGSQAVATLARPAPAVQTGGFGDPNGIKGDGKPGSRTNIATAGGFDLPTGPGQGNGTGGARGTRGTVASAGFGTGVAIGNTDRVVRAAVQKGGFTDAPVTTEAPRPTRVLPVAATTTPVQILSKPNPIYTDEARALKLEGEVLLRVEFDANGECRVLQVLRGLGHGLDESAVRAAKQIRFRPATENGQSVTSTASLHVVFQLAY